MTQGGGMTTIPHLEARQKLLALYQERRAVWREEDEALAPLLELFEAQERRAAEEFHAAGGHKGAMTIAMLKDPTQTRLQDEYDAKIEPQRSALRAAREVFEDRKDQVQDPDRCDRAEDRRQGLGRKLH
jgi:hypothetical protein